MTLSESSIKSLDYIRTKVEKQFYDFNTIEKAALKEVFEEIQLEVTKRKVTLDTSCSGCIKSAVNVCFNFVKFHEVRKASKPEKPTTPANVDRVSTNDIPTFKIVDVDNGGVENVSIVDLDKFHGNEFVSFSPPKEDYTKLSLPQLRALFPKIKDTSKEGFIEKILEYEKATK